MSDVVTFDSDYEAEVLEQFAKFCKVLRLLMLMEVRGKGISETQLKRKPSKL